MRRFPQSILALLLAIGCAKARPLNTGSEARPLHPIDRTSLTECTAQVWSDMGDILAGNVADESLPAWARTVKPAQLSDANLAKALDAVSAWAARYCYLPCQYEMCAAFLRSKDDDLVAYVVPRERFFIPPEAMVHVSDDFDSCPEQILWHSGCALRRGECALPE